MTDPLTDISQWMREHDVDLEAQAYLDLERLLVKYHQKAPPIPRGLPVIEMGDSVDWAKFEKK